MCDERLRQGLRRPGQPGVRDDLRQLLAAHLTEPALLHEHGVVAVEVVDGEEGRRVVLDQGALLVLARHLDDQQVGVALTRRGVDRGPARGSVHEEPLAADLVGEVVAPRGAQLDVGEAQADLVDVQGGRGPGGSLGHVTQRYSTRDTRSGESKRAPSDSRSPRAQSAAAICRAPNAFTSPSLTAVVAVPTSTSALPTRSAPGSSRSSVWVTGPSLTRVSSYVVQAPGAGVQARIRRSTATAGSPHATCASATVILGARLMPSTGCGRASRLPSSMPSRVATRSPAPPSASRASRSPAVSVSRIVSVITPYVGPASISLMMRNVVAPVTSSPAQIACCTGAAPRHAGRHEKWRLTQPWAGMSSALCGSRAP